jgi:hypothetical protein
MVASRKACTVKVSLVTVGGRQLSPRYSEHLQGRNGPMGPPRIICCFQFCDGRYPFRVIEQHRHWTNWTLGHLEAVRTTARRHLRSCAGMADCPCR